MDWLTSGCCLELPWGFPKGAKVIAWCGKYKYPKQAVHTFTKYDNSAENCAQLSREYCRRGEHFYLIYVASLDADHQFTQAEIDAYPPNLEWINWLLSIDPECISRRRAREIDMLAPRLGIPG